MAGSVTLNLPRVRVEDLRSDAVRKQANEALNSPL